MKVRKVYQKWAFLIRRVNLFNQWGKLKLSKEMEMGGLRKCGDICKKF
jgi:hypothetical protein